MIRFRFRYENAGTLRQGAPFGRWHTGAPTRLSALAVAVCAAMSGVACAQAPPAADNKPEASPGGPAPLTQVFARPTTSSLSSGEQFFQPVKQALGTTLPVTSMVVDESSTSLGAVTVPDPQGRETGQPEAVVTPVPVPPSRPRSICHPAKKPLPRAYP